jgi:rhamnulokinase
MKTYYLACDLGADNGRIVLGTLSKGQLTLKEIHRFPMKTERVKGLLCWDLVSLEKEIFAGIEAAARLDLPISGLSTDSWGVDYVLLDAADRPLQSPACTRKGPGKEATTRLLKKLPLATIYAETGIPLLPLHTLFQIEAAHRADPALFKRAERFLPIADYLNTRMSGVAVCEESLASTTQLYNPKTHAWSPEVVAALELPGPILRCSTRGLSPLVRMTAPPPLPPSPLAPNKSGPISIPTAIRNSASNWPRQS